LTSVGQGAGQVSGQVSGCVLTDTYI
jgi:hypothetical protein